MLQGERVRMPRLLGLRNRKRPKNYLDLLSLQHSYVVRPAQSELPTREYAKGPPWFLVEFLGQCGEFSVEHVFQKFVRPPA